MRSKVAPTTRKVAPTSKSVIMSSAATGALRKASIQAMAEAQAQKKARAGENSQVLQAMPWLPNRSVITGGQQLFDGMFKHFYHNTAGSVANLDFELMTEAPFTTIMLDLLMYENPDLFHTAMTLLVRKYSTRAALRSNTTKLHFPV